MELDEHIPGSRPNQLPTMPASPMSPASGPHFIDNNFGCDPPGALTTASRVDLGTADQIMPDAVGVLS
jgi:hypothetical protein